MTDWPDKMTVAPIREWPGTLRANRQPAKFMRPGRWEGKEWIGQSPMPLSVTLADLDRELRHLGAKGAELLVAIDAAQFRNDGRPYANAKAAHPGVILSFEIPKIGQVSYPCDKYTRWEDNLRAIAAALEALRLVDRHGVTRSGEQYRGFMALEATAAPAGFSSASDALAFLRQVSRVPADIYEPPESHMPRLMRAAKRAAHPDTGGDAATFQRVSLAEAKLREEGLL